MWTEVSGECSFSSELWCELALKYDKNFWVNAQFYLKCDQSFLDECSFSSEVWQKLSGECSFSSEVWREHLGECSFSFEVFVLVVQVLTCTVQAYPQHSFRIVLYWIVSETVVRLKRTRCCRMDEGYAI